MQRIHFVVHPRVVFPSEDFADRAGVPALQAMAVGRATDAVLEDVNKDPWAAASVVVRRADGSYRGYEEDGSDGGKRQTERDRVLPAMLAPAGVMVINVLRTI